jgi:hypothetical protein
MVQRSFAARRVIVALLAIVGAYYAFAGSVTLLTISDVTRRWVEHSGDPDFRFDFDQFRFLIVSGAAIWLVLGVATVLCSVRTLAGNPVKHGYWAALAALAVVVHIPWMIYKIISTGVLPRPEAGSVVRAAGFRFAAVALLYVVGLLATRRWPAGRATG